MRRLDHMDQTTEDLIAVLRLRGYRVERHAIIDQGEVEVDRLADLIANGETVRALELLHELAPNARLPQTTMFLRDLRASQFEV